MSTTTTAITGTVDLGGRIFTVERPTGLKASRALAILKELSRAAPALQTELAAFRGRYEKENVLELDRVQAKLRYPPVVLTNDQGDAILDPDGAPRMIPSPVDRLTAEDWENAGGVYRMPASPSAPEVGLALLGTALEVAEDTVYRFLALFTIPNGELKLARRAGTDQDLIRQRADELLDDVFADDLVELAVLVGESLDHHFRRKAADLGDRMGKALSLFGIEPRKTPPTPPAPAPLEDLAEPKTTEPSSLKPSLSTDSLPSTADGDQTSSSTPPSTSFSRSEDTPNATPSEPPLNSTTPA